MLDAQIPELNIERDERSGCLLLEQDSGGNIDRVALHPIHLRFLAEQCGLVDASDPEAMKIIATLKRRMRLLRDRIDHLTDSLAENKDYDRADINYEVTYAVATADIADEFVAEMDGQGEADASSNAEAKPKQMPKQSPQGERTESGQKADKG